MGCFAAKIFCGECQFWRYGRSKLEINNPGRVLQFLKKNAAGGAIFYTAVSTILGHQNRNYTFTLDEEELPPPSQISTC
jgi:hypothetical protein